MTNTRTTTTDADSTAEEASREATGAPGFAGMCQSFADMGAQMMEGGMPECFRPGASEDADGSGADETSSR